MEETWKEINGYESFYKISNLGRVFSKKTTSLRKVQQRPDNYCYINLYKDKKYKNFYIHRLVAAHFLSNPLNKEEVNHIDGNRSNNVFTNLEWVTKSENELHAFKYNNKQPGRPFLGKKGKESINSKRIIQYSLQNEELNRFDSITIAAEETCINRRSISYACNGKYKTSGGFKWKYE